MLIELPLNKEVYNKTSEKAKLFDEEFWVTR